MGGDVKERLSLLCQSLDNVSERIIIQQAINLLRHYEARISGMEATVSNMCQEVAMCRSMSSPEDSPPSTGSPSSTVDPCRKPSPRIIATVLPFSGLPNPRQEDTRPFCSLPNPSRPDEFCSLPNPSRPDEEEEEDLMTIESPFRKLFRENDSMQESGIYFEDEDLGFHCQGTQTDSANQSRLSEELRKLSQIRQKLEQEQEREKYFKPIKEDKSKIMCSRQELEYYKEEMERLELRLQLYESCGEEHNARLKTMLERDEILKKQLHRLEEDNMKLRRDNQFLEMEKCEYEELENDTRLQCQRLEVKLNSMNEKKLELQTQLSHNARLINNLKSNLEDNDKSKAEAAERLQAAQDRIQSLETTISCYETSLNKCEQKNFELEEKEMELKYRVYLLENILPVLISYHLYWIVERSRAFSRQCTSSKYEMISCDNSSNSVLPLSSKSNRIDNTRALALLDVESPEQSRIDHTENKHSELNATSHSIPNKCHIETQTMFDDMAILRNECQCQLRVHTDSSEGDSESPLPNDECISQTSQKSQPNEPHINSSEQLQCENCANNNTTATLNMEKIEELNRMISDLKIKEKLYEQTMSEADEMFSNMTLEYGVQIENLENQINTTTLDLRAMKKELEKEREENDRMSNGNVELMKEIKAKENEKKQLNNMLECLKMQLEEEQEESLKFKQEISSFKKLFETEKSKCKELEMDLKEANREIKEIESRVESSVKSHDKEMDRMSKKLEDMVVTNGELKEEVDTLEVSDRKSLRIGK
ncbi:early endosome antigen 1-like [Diaphorina citri]|uniref:Early endosome antigen 1-like n=1 Tax=Diaphorina citri TaxID=121845 RepID=A0A3Q0IP72_DIACI|nr:early endosome antigen 1-like [Diaphorina citri]